MQADPLGLVDGASIYGYVRQNPGRYVDPRGEFGIIGAIVGAVLNTAVQVGINYAYGNQDLWTAFKCVNLSSVANAAAFGAIGVAPLGQIFGAVRGRSASGVAKGVGTGALVGYVALSHPKIVFGDECECKFEDAPTWVNFIKTQF